MRYLHTQKRAWLCRCLTAALLLSVTAAGATGWARAFYLFGSGDGADTVLDGSQAVIESVLLNLDTGKSGGEAKLTEGTMVTVRRGGETLTATAKAETVKRFLSRMGIVPGPLEMVGIELMENSVVLTVSDHLTAYERVTEVTPYETVYRETPDLPMGQEQVVQTGADGEHTLIYEQTWASGELVTRQFVEEISTEPVAEIIERGTALTGAAPGDNVVDVITYEDGSGLLKFSSGGTLKFTRALAMTATAYTAGEAGVDYTTATGTFVRRGVVAVDKRVIPLGSEVYVMAKGCEYGLAQVEDTGVKGAKIDLYMDTYQECIQFGRRSATVYLLEGD